MGTQAVRAEYLSTGANRQTAVADWSRGGLIAFGADINVALWEPAVRIVILVLLSVASCFNHSFIFSPSIEVLRLYSKTLLTCDL